GVLHRRARRIRLSRGRGAGGRSWRAHGPFATRPARRNERSVGAVCATIHWDDDPAILRGGSASHEYRRLEREPVTVVAGYGGAQPAALATAAVISPQCRRGTAACWSR